MIALALRVAIFAVLLVFKSNAEIQCQAGAIDLVFVIDQSDSVGEDNFMTGLEAAVDLTNTLDIGTGSDQSRVGLVLFHYAASVWFNLDKFTTKAKVVNALRNVIYNGGMGTDIASGMDVAIKQIFQIKGRKDVPRVMIIITDGQDTSDVRAEQSQAKESHIITYAIGVGADVDAAELERATGDRNRVYTVADYSQLSKVMSLICKEFEETTVPPTATVTPALPSYDHNHATCSCDTEDDYLEAWLDVIIIFDSSTSMGVREFDAQKALISSTAKYYQMGKGEAATPGKFIRFAVINNGAEAVRVANLTTFNNAVDLETAINNTKSIGGTFDPLRGLNEAVGMIEEEAAARRRLNVRKAIILFTSADIDCTDTPQKMMKGIQRSAAPENVKTCRLAAQLLADKVSLITIAWKLPEDEHYPDVNIADKCNRVQNDEKLAEDLLHKLCMANCYCLPPYTQFTVDDKCEKYSECVFVHGLSTVYGIAQSACAEEGDKLTNMFSKDKQQFLKDLHLDATFFPFWIGGKYTPSGITWDSGIQGDSSDFTGWAAGQPDNSNGKECIAFKQIKGFVTGWTSEKCGRVTTPAYYFSCQRPSCTVWNYCEN